MRNMLARWSEIFVTRGGAFTRILFFGLPGRAGAPLARLRAGAHGKQCRKLSFYEEASNIKDLFVG